MIKPLQRLRDLAQQVDAVFDDMAKTFSDYQKKTDLLCRAGCGQCCLQPTVEATVLEMLPLAFYLYDQGIAESTYNAITESESSRCFFYQKHSDNGLNGQCGIYAQRGSICRMFGAAGYSDKYGNADLSVCKVIKQDRPAIYNDIILSLSDNPPPMMKDWKEKIRVIDYEMGHEDMPITEAAKRAIEKVLVMASYS